MFGRKRARRSSNDEDALVTATPQGSEEAPRKVVQSDRPNGPWDESERPDPQENQVDLGSLRVQLRAGVDLRVEVDKKSGRANRVMLVTADSAVQVVTVAAPRSRSYWDEVREAIKENATTQGGTVKEIDSEFGPALSLTMPVLTKDGKQARSEDGRPLAQPSLVLGVDGPRWMLRATFLGRAAFEESARAPLLPVVRSIVVFRGSEAKVPGEPLVLTPAAPPKGQDLVLTPDAAAAAPDAGQSGGQAEGQAENQG